MSPKQKVDYKKFKEMWFKGDSAKTIAKEFDIGFTYVHILRKKLFLPTRPNQRSVKVEKKIIDRLKETPKNYIEFSKLKKDITPSIISRLVRKRIIFRVCFDLSKGAGDYKRFSHDSMFEKEVYLKTFICLDRTAVVRLLIDSCIYPEKTGERTIFTHFLKQNLSEAERCAVLFKLGKKKWYQNSTKQSIQVNGVLFPQKRKGKKINPNVEDLNDIISTFQEKIGYDNYFTSGGCYSFAIAIYDLLEGTELYTYGRVHYFVKYKNVYVDAKGIHKTKNDLISEGNYPPEDGKDWKFEKVYRKEVMFDANFSDIRRIKNYFEREMKKRKPVETTKEEFVQFKWLQNKMGSVKRLQGVDCGSCSNLVRVKEKFEGYGWIETGEYCKFKVFVEIQPTHLTLQNAIADVKQYHNDKLDLPNVMAELKKKHKNGNFKPGVWVATINEQVLVSVTREYAYENFKGMLKREPTPEQVTKHKRICEKFLQERIARSNRCKFYDGSGKPRVKYMRKLNNDHET